MKNSLFNTWNFVFVLTIIGVVIDLGSTFMVANRHGWNLESFPLFSNTGFFGMIIIDLIFILVVGIFCFNKRIRQRADLFFFITAYCIWGFVIRLLAGINNLSIYSRNISEVASYSAVVTVQEKSMLYTVFLMNNFVLPLLITLFVWWVYRRSYKTEEKNNG